MAGAAARIQLAMKMKKNKLLSMKNTSEYKLNVDQRSELLEALRNDQRTLFLANLAEGKAPFHAVGD